MKATSSEIEKFLQMISETPLQVREAVRDIDEARLQFKADPKSWSANDLLAHLRACADLWTHSIYAMLAEQEPVFSDIDERRWTKVTRYSDLPFAESLHIFSLQRDNLPRVLKPLPLEAWERAAIIFERKHTVFSQVRRMAKHESEHVAQIGLLLKNLKPGDKR
jgi:hypothetical protein